MGRVIHAPILDCRVNKTDINGYKETWAQEMVPSKKNWHVNTDRKGWCQKRQKPQAPTPQAPIRNRQTRKLANAKGLNRNTNLT